jgi:copper(I)-binding protein
VETPIKTKIEIEKKLENNSIKSMQKPDPEWLIKKKIETSMA